MSESKGVLFVPYKDTLGLLNVEDALRICEQVYAMHARGSVVLSNPPSSSSTWRTASTTTGT